MLLERGYCDTLLSVAERRAAGQARRKLVPRSRHAEWRAPADRSDPVQRLIDTGRHRISHLVPIRHHRMRESPFTFLRGAAAVMAADLAATPSSGLWVQACGDCHLANFGCFTAADGSTVFDITDFDETLPAPFEWDLKRLATSFVAAASSRGLPPKASRALARTVALAYRVHMHELMRLDPLQCWQSRIDVAQALAGIADDRLRERETRRLAVVLDADRHGYPKLLERHRGAWRLRPHPPLIFPLCDSADDTHEIAVRTAFRSYQQALPDEHRVLVERYRLVDLAFKVVGIAAVGTFCAIGLFATPEGAILLLQVKEAQRSVLAAHAGPSRFCNQGHRVVSGQRLLQVEPDPMLGWTEHLGDDQHCYVRHVRDARLAMFGLELADLALPHYAVLCGSALARAHARSGDAAGIAGYMGSGGVFDAAIADFAMAYAQQTERDWRLFLEAIKSGLIVAESP